MVKFEDIKVGYEITPVVKEITQEKINKYADASKDYNPLHVDPEFAKNTMFGGTIAHGLLSLAYISQMMTNWVSKAWISGGELEVTFLAPVRPGDTITSKGKVIDKDEGKGIVTCEVYCENQKGEKVVIGKTRVNFKKN